MALADIGNDDEPQPGIERDRALLDRLLQQSTSDERSQLPNS
jgi:hypothetical protein